MEDSSQGRCAYVELNLVHDEIQPTFWWLAQQAGVEIDFFLQSGRRHKDVFCRVPGPVRVIPMDCADPHRPCDAPIGLEHLWTTDNYDFLILGTSEPADRIEKVARLDLPKLLVQHNSTRQQAAPPSGATWCVLAPHVRDRLSRADPELPVLAISPLFLGEVAIEEKPLVKVFVVQGNLQFHRRNYASLVRAVRELKEEGYTKKDFVVRLVGRWRDDPGWPARLDGERFRSLLERRDLVDLFQFPEREYDFAQYFERMRSARYVLPLIDDVHCPARSYLERKVTSSIGQGIGWLNIPVINRTLAGRLEIDFGYQYDGSDLITAMRAALEARDDGDQLAKVAGYRERRLQASLQAFRRWSRGVMAS